MLSNRTQTLFRRYFHVAEMQRVANTFEGSKANRIAFERNNPILTGVFAIANRKFPESEWDRHRLLPRASQFIKMLDHVDSRVSEDGRRYVRNRMKAELEQTEDPLGLLAELRTYGEFDHPDNKISFNLGTGQGDLNIQYREADFTVEIKSVRRGLVGQHHIASAALILADPSLVQLMKERGLNVFSLVERTGAVKPAVIHRTVRTILESGLSGLQPLVDQSTRTELGYVLVSICVGFEETRVT